MKISLIILFFANLWFCKAQKPEGLWISYYDYFIESNLADDEIVGGSALGPGYLLDFDNHTIRHIRRDSMVNLNIDYYNSILSAKSVKYDTIISVDFKILSKDSLEIDIKNNMIDVFKPLDLSYKLNITHKEVTDFLVNNNIQKPFESLEIKFNLEFFRNDIEVSEHMRRKKLTNETWNFDGYWYIREIKEIFFLIINFDGMTELVIFQILSMDECKMKLNPIGNLDFVSNSNSFEIKLKDCL